MLYHAVIGDKSEKFVDVTKSRGQIVSSLMRILNSDLRIAIFVSLLVCFLLDAMSRLLGHRFFPASCSCRVTKSRGLLGVIRSSRPQKTRLLPRVGAWQSPLGHLLCSLWFDGSDGT